MIAQFVVSISRIFNYDKQAFKKLLDNFRGARPIHFSQCIVYVDILGLGKRLGKVN